MGPVDVLALLSYEGNDFSARDYWFEGRPLLAFVFDTHYKQFVWPAIRDRDQGRLTSIAELYEKIALEGTDEVTNALAVGALELAYYGLPDRTLCTAWLRTLGPACRYLAGIGGD